MPHHLLQSIHTDADGNLDVLVERIKFVGIRKIGFLVVPHDSISRY
jgi:hypothetical protein